LLEPQDGHAPPSGAPHWPQNFMPAALSALQRGQIMPTLRRLYAVDRQTPLGQINVLLSDGLRQ